jgi:hypothetical protein
VCPEPQHRAQGLPRRHARTRGARIADVAPIHGQPRAPTRRFADDDRGGTGLCVERGGHKAVLRRPFPGTPVVRARVGPLNSRRLRGGGAQRDELPADAPRDPGGAGGVCHSNGCTGHTRATAAR